MNVAGTNPTAQNHELAEKVADLLEKFQHEVTDSGALTYATEIIRLVRQSDHGSVTPLPVSGSTP